MRYSLALSAVLCLAFAGSALAEEELKPADVLKAVRNIDLKLESTTDPVKADKEVFSFDQAKDEVIWVRTYPGPARIVQVYTIAKEKMTVKDGEVIIPLVWVSMANPKEINYNPDKHDVGLRVKKVEGKWVVLLYAIDTQGQEADMKFVEGKEEKEKDD